MKKFILAVCLMTGIAPLVWADPITFEATINVPKVSLDEVLQLTLTVTGVNTNLAPISLPVLDGFTAKYLGPSTSVSIINGDYHSERSFIYDLFPNRIGHFQIPPISATIAGQTYTTKPIDVDVVPNTTQPPSGSQPVSANAAPTAESLKDKIKIMVSIDRSTVYLNEKVPVSVKLLVNDVPMRDIQYPQFQAQGFSVDDFDKPQQSSEVIDGVKYDTVEFKTSIYPNRLGDVTVGPIQIGGNVLYKTGQSNPFANANDFFGSGVFNSFFDSYANRPVSITADPLVLHVLPLPQENRPADFSDAIGQFDFHASVAPGHVKAGDPLTLKMQVDGTGNFKSVKMPVFQAAGFKAYPPQIKTLGGQKTAEEVIIPTSPDIKEVPALSFSYFDTAARDYKTVTQGPFPVVVSAPNPDEEFKAVGFSDVSKEPPAPSNTFSLLKFFRHLLQVLSKLSQSLWFWLGLGTVLAAGLAYFLWRGFKQKLANDPAFARRLAAFKDAKQSLAEAGKFMSANRPKDFYAQLSKTLHDYLADKWHMPAAALNTEDILSRLKASHVDDTAVSSVKLLLEQCDMVCFAGSAVSAEKMAVDLSQTFELLARLEKALK